jgi:N-acyl-D-aspartate/D-glutamate deacylase
MGELQGVLEATARLVTALGPGWTLVVLGGLLGYHALREWRKGKRERSIADEKEAQIQRLAEDNRWMRRVLMSKAMNYSEEEIDKLLGQGRPTPLLSTKKETER